MCPVTPSHILAHSGSLLGPLGHIQMMALSLLQQPTFDMMPFYSPPQSCKGVGSWEVFEEVTGDSAPSAGGTPTAPWLCHGGVGGRFCSLRRTSKNKTSLHLFPFFPHLSSLQNWSCIFSSFPSKLCFSFSLKTLLLSN